MYSLHTCDSVSYYSSDTVWDCYCYSTILRPALSLENQYWRKMMFGILVLDYMEFARLPIWEFERPMKEKFVALKTITGYGYDNEHLKIQSITGQLYSVMITRESCQWGSIRHKQLQGYFGERVEINKCYTLHLWDGRGCTSLFGTTFEIKDYNDALPEEVVKEVHRAISEFESGIVSCSDCGEPTQTNSRRQYFAGIYCSECWKGTKGLHKDKGGWREVEANETYN